MTEKQKTSVVKIVELVGISQESWEDAAQNAVREASQTLNNITGVGVLRCTGTVENGKIIEYKANVKIAFGLTDR